MDDKNKQRSTDLEGFAPAAASSASKISSGTTATATATLEAAGGIDATTAMATDKLQGGIDIMEATTPKKKKQPKRKDKDTNKRLAAIFNSSSSSNRNNHHNSNTDNNNVTASTEISPLSEIGPNFSPCTLPQIQSRLKDLMTALPPDIPPVPAEEFDVNDPPDGSNAKICAQIRSFASQLQQTIENYNLLLSLVSSATYKWGVDRSGASQQNLSVMVAELQQCQEMISSSVSGRLSNVLCPAVDVLVGEVEIARGGGSGDAAEVDDANHGSKKRKLNDADTGSSDRNERRINHYIRTQVDPAYVHLCHVILARNASLIRHTVATSIHTAEKVIADYLKAMKKDGGHDMAV